MRKRLQSAVISVLIAGAFLLVEGHVQVPGIENGEGLRGVAWAGTAGAEGDSVVIKLGQTLFLEPNVPNPFDKTTRIAYTLDRETPVTLRVFDAFYNDVRTLVNGQVQAPGRYVVDFEPDGKYSSTMYFYSLTTDAGIETRRMLLVR